MGPSDKYMLADDSLQSTKSGFDVKVFSHWYRSLPVSSIGTLQLKIDGVKIATDDLTIEIEGKKFGLSQLPELYTLWWFILDPAIMHFESSSLQLKKGQRYQVELEMGLLIPYVLTGKEEKPLLASSSLSKELICN